MNPSDELTNWVASVFALRDPTVVGSAVADHPDVVTIGTEADEWIEGGAAMRTAFAEQVSAGVTVEQRALRAFVEGAVGWGAGRVAFVLPTGERIEARITFVAHREGAAWKLVQSHASIGR